MLYHHGIRHRRDLVLLTAEGHAWLEHAPLPETAREQVTVALQVIDALDRQLPTLDRQLRAYARHQAGCKALMGHTGSVELNVRRDPRRTRRLPPVLLLAPRRPLRRPGHHRVSVRSAPLARAPEPARPSHVALGAVRGRRRRQPLRLARPRLLPPSRRPARAKRACLAVARKLLNAATTRYENSATMRSDPHEPPHRAPAPHVSRCTAASSRQTAAATPAWTARKDRAAAPHFPKRERHPITIMSPAPQPTRVVDQDKHGRPRAQPPPTTTTGGT